MAAMELSQCFSSRDDEAGKKQKGEVKICEKSVCGPSAKKGKGAWELRPDGGKRTYYFRCASGAEREEWIALVNGVIQN